MSRNRALAAPPAFIPVPSAWTDCSDPIVSRLAALLDDRSAALGVLLQLYAWTAPLALRGSLRGIEPTLIAERCGWHRTDPLALVAALRASGAVDDDDRLVDLGAR